MNSVLLTSAYLPPIQYFSKIYGAPCIYMETYEHYVKQTYRNRALIAGPNGVQALTIPVEHEYNKRPATRDIRLSDHGNWQHLHRNALQSAYEGSPYFEYYADDILPIYNKGHQFLVDFNEDFLYTICDLLSLTPNVVKTEAYADALALGADDFRETIRPKNSHSIDKTFRSVEYYQVFRHKHGFLENLSIIDLLFNMGPESRLVLRDSIVP
jgi:hypothetical protein